MLTISGAFVVAGGNYIEVDFTGAEGFVPISPGTGITGFVFTKDDSPTVIFATSLGPGMSPSSLRFFFENPIYFGSILTLTTSGTNVTDAFNDSLTDVTDYAVTNNSLILPPATLSSVDTTAASGTVIDPSGNTLSGQTVTFKLKILPDSVSGVLVNADEWTVTSNSDGVIATTLIQEATYMLKLGDGDYENFVAGNTGTMTLPNLIGHSELSQAD